MKLATAQLPKNNLGDTAQVLRYLLVITIILMVVSQLMTIEKLLPIIQNYQLPGGSPVTKSIIFILTTSGIFGLPFLLRMNLSPLFRFVSALLLNLYAIIWVKLGIWIMISDPPLIGTGLFGSFFKTIPPESVLPFASILLVVTLTTTWLMRRDLIPSSKHKAKK
jgi:hypothetical protein